MLTFSLLTPVILPIATVAFGSACLAYQHVLLHLANITVETQGRLYFPAFFHLFVGLYAQQLTFIGLFILKFDPRNKSHDLGQLAVLTITLLLCIQYHVHLKRRFALLIRHYEAGMDAPHLTSVPRSPSQCDTPRASSTPTSDVFGEVADRPTKPTAIIWLPKDGLGIGGRLGDHVRAKYLASSGNVVQMVDSDARITDDGQVTVETEGVSLAELPRLTMKS